MVMDVHKITYREGRRAMSPAQVIVSAIEASSPPSPAPNHCSRSGFEALRKARRVVLPVPRLAAIREPSELAAVKSHPLVDGRAIHAHDVGHVLAHLSSL